MNDLSGNNQQEASLVQRVVQGDNAAFGVIIKNTEGLVAQIVFKMGVDAAYRKDIVQNIYLKVFKGLPGFKFRSKLATWVGNIAYNTCLNWLEKKKLVLTGDWRSVDDNEDGAAAAGTHIMPSNQAETLVFNKQLSAILASATESLPPLYKTLITLYHNEELSYADIAQITGLPEGTVKNYLFRARKALKQKLLKQYKKEEL